MTENITPSDLIYLYLDGEADAIQQTSMFASLATDTELQQEFHEALSMRKAFAHERLSTKPPLYLTNMVFRDAGLIPATVGAGAVGSALWLWIKRAGIPVGALVVGSTMTFYGLKWTGSLRDTQSEQQLAERNSAQLNNKQNSSSTDNSNGSSVPAFASEQAVPPSATMRTTANRNRNLAASASTTLEQIANSEEQESVGEFVREQNAVGTARALLPGSTRRGLSMVNVSSPLVNVGKLSDFSVQFNRIASLHMYGGADKQVGAAQIDNMSVTILYNLDENIALGVTAGKKMYALSELTSTKTQQNPSYWTYLIDGKYTLNSRTFLDAQPYMELSAGLTSNSQPVADLNIGLSIPVWILRVNTGLEAGTLFYSADGKSQQSWSIAFVSGISYNF